jgi:hypothetical protein
MIHIIFNMFNIEDKMKYLIMTHRGNPYLLFLTVEAWGGAYTFPQGVG